MIELVWVAFIVAAAIGLLLYLIVDMVRFERQRQRWKQQDAEFWELMERWQPGIREQTRARLKRR